ncbi:MAG: bifunctional nuclease family protein [Chloroflexota bacterium]
MSKMVEVVIDSIRVSLMSQQRIVILREVGAERYLPIWIGQYEAEAITIALQNVEVARPMTHDLLKNALQNLDTRVVRVEVVSLHDDVYYGKIIIERDGKTINLDSRPSDALALAVRVHVPIMVSQEVMDVAGIIPEEDIEHEPAPELEEEDQLSDAESARRLSVFEDFLDKLELDKEEGEEDEEA